MLTLLHLTHSRFGYTLAVETQLHSLLLLFLRIFVLLPVLAEQLLTARCAVF